MSKRLKYIQTLPFNTLIDMGCGIGEAIVEMADLRPQADFLGIDVDQSILDKARSKLRNSSVARRVEFVCGNCLSVPLANDSADIILFRGLLHHVERIECALEEVRRLLRTGGFLLIQDGEQMPDSIFDEMNAALCRSGLPAEVHPGFSIPVLTDQLRNHDLVTQAVIREGVATFATPPYTPKVYSTGLFLLSARKM